MYRPLHPGHGVVALRPAVDGDGIRQDEARPARRLHGAQADVTFEEEVDDAHHQRRPILGVLVDHVGRYVSRYTILNEAWDGDTDISSNVIDVHVGRLRAKIDTPFGRSAIQTMRGVGYRLDPAGG